MLIQHLRRRRQSCQGAESGGASPALDAAALDKLRQLDPDGRRGFVAQVLRTYEASLLRYLAELADARLAQDLRRIGQTAHTLKSSSAAVGALGFSACCADVEKLSRAGDASVLGLPLTRLEEESSRVLAAVRAMLPP